MPNRPAGDAAANQPARFLTTQWNLVLTAKDGFDSKAGEALAELYGFYWLPLYAYARRKGQSVEDSEDLTQGFFAHLLERDGLRNVSPVKGRFRTFLLSGFQHYLSDERRRREARKRGGRTVHLSLDTCDAEKSYQRFAPADTLTPEKAFMRSWVFTVLDRALERLRIEWAESGKGPIYDALHTRLTDDSSGPSHQETASRLGMTEGAVKVAMHRMRKRYAALLREDIQRTVSDPSETEDEIRGLFEALS